MDETLPNKELLLYIFDLQDAIHQGLLKYEIKTKVNGLNKYSDLRSEIWEIINKFWKDRAIKKSEDVYWHILLNLESSFSISQPGKNVITKDNLEKGKFFILRLYFHFDNSKVEDSLASYDPAILFYVVPPFK